VLQKISSGNAGHNPPSMRSRLVSSEGLRPSDSSTRALARRCAGSLPPPLKRRRTRRSAFGAKAGRSRGSLASARSRSYLLPVYEIASSVGQPVAELPIAMPSETRRLCHNHVEMRRSTQSPVSSARCRRSCRWAGCSGFRGAELSAGNRCLSSRFGPAGGRASGLRPLCGRGWFEAMASASAPCTSVRAMISTATRWRS